MSEFMLQQTQVARVVEKFAPFLERFPTAAALAGAPEHDVLAAWSGLGYYRRARLLHAAAKAIAQRHGGEVPADAAALRDLPGVGPYTAGAIASIVFGRREPLADGNVARVLLRVNGERDRPAAAPSTMKWVWSRARELLDTPAGGESPARLNEGMMELGATVCTPRAPRCDDCPLRTHCRARSSGEQELIPPPKARAARTPVLAVSVVVRNPAGQVLLERRSTAGMWAGMWQAPTLERAAPDAAATRRNMAAELRKSLGLSKPPRFREAFEHTTTHRDVVFAVYESDGPARLAGPDRVWASPDGFEAYGLSNAQQRVLRGVSPPDQKRRTRRGS
ncbi:MAG: A/G-specific adenine glycosylase [Phycisphaerales bacterium]